MVKSSMKFLKRHSKKNEPQGHSVVPSNHYAMLIVKNEHFDVDYAHDLSDLTYEQLQQVHSYITFMQHYDNMSVEDFEDDDDMYELDEDDE